MAKTKVVKISPTTKKSASKGSPSKKKANLLTKNRAPTKVLKNKKIWRQRKPKKLSTKGVVYLSHIPHGFYEDQILNYFKQFGKVTAVSVPRSKTGRAKGFAFVEFTHPEVAEIAADTMNNYLMLNRVIKAKYIPPAEQKPQYFYAARAKREQHKTVADEAKRNQINNRKLKNRKLTPRQEAIVARKLLDKSKKMKQKLAKLGLSYEFQIQDGNMESIIESNKELSEAKKRTILEKETENVDDILDLDTEDGPSFSMKDDEELTALFDFADRQGTGKGPVKSKWKKVVKVSPPGVTVEVKQPEVESCTESLKQQLLDRKQRLLLGLVKRKLSLELKKAQGEMEKQYNQLGKKSDKADKPITEVKLSSPGVTVEVKEPEVESCTDSLQERLQLKQQMLLQMHKHKLSMELDKAQAVVEKQYKQLGKKGGKADKPIIKVKVGSHTESLRELILHKQKILLDIQYHKLKLELKTAQAEVNEQYKQLGRKKDKIDKPIIKVKVRSGMEGLREQMIHKLMALLDLQNQNLKLELDKVQAELEEQYKLLGKEIGKADKSITEVKASNTKGQLRKKRKADQTTMPASSPINKKMKKEKTTITLPVANKLSGTLEPRKEISSEKKIIHVLKPTSQKKLTKKSREQIQVVPPQLSPKPQKDLLLSAKKVRHRAGKKSM